MNINKIILNGNYAPYMRCVTLTIQYPKSTVIGYDLLGRPIREDRAKTHTVMGVNKTECKHLAKQFLKNEKYEREHLFGIMELKIKNETVRLA